MPKSYIILEGDESGNFAEVTLDNELKVIDSNSGLPEDSTAVQESEGFSTARNKLELVDK